MMKKFFTEAEARAMVPKRAYDANKGDAGKVLIVAGSPGMAGAAILAAKGAYRAGAGLVKVAAPGEVIAALQVAVPEATTLTINKMEKSGSSPNAAHRILEASKGFHSMVVGPGLGRAPETKKLVKEIITNAEIPLVLDADALNLIADDLEILHSAGTDIIMTPHPAEMGRLVKKTAREVNAAREKIAGDFAQKYGVTLVLKGKGTVVADPTGEISINTSGNPGMATAGSGDVLSGIAGAFAAIMPTDRAARLAVYVHGLAGDIGIKEEGVFGLMASDIADNTGKALTLITD